MSNRGYLLTEEGEYLESTFNISHEDEIRRKILKRLARHTDWGINIIDFPTDFYKKLIKSKKIDPNTKIKIQADICMAEELGYKTITYRIC
jgi:hypothetical protein